MKNCRLKSVRDRLYLGIAEVKKSSGMLSGNFLTKRGIFKVINEFPYLKERSKKEMITYLNGFFNGFDKRNTKRS